MLLRLLQDSTDSDSLGSVVANLEQAQSEMERLSEQDPAEQDTWKAGMDLLAEHASSYLVRVCCC